MVSFENRVIVGSFVLFVFSVVGGATLDHAAGTALLEQPLLAFLLVYGLPVVVPQLYLAATDNGDVSPRTRVRFAAVFTGVFALVIAGSSGVQWSNALDDLEALQYTLIGVIGIGAFAGLLCYEFVVGYRSSGGNGATRAR